MNNENTINYALSVRLEEAEKRSDAPEVHAYAFDARGAPVANTALKEGKGTLRIPAELEGQQVRMLFGPAVHGREAAREHLLRHGALERMVRVDAKRPAYELAIRPDVWGQFLRCRCTVRGRLVKRVTLPDGSTMDLPVCNSRVTVCEVDRVPRIIFKLPDPILVNLRDRLLEEIRKPIRIPPPPPPPPVGPHPGPGPDPAPFSARLAKGAKLMPLEQALAGFDGKTASSLRALSSTSSLEVMRSSLVEVAPLLFPYLCGWPFLEPFWGYRKDCLPPVMVDENGAFEVTLYYPCLGDKPDIYISAEQHRDGGWKSIYKPSVRCSTRWDYKCGEEITIVVTDPGAVACQPPPPVVPPAGVTRWVMPYSVGDTRIWGEPSGSPAAPTGWVRTDGKTDYVAGGLGLLADSPFGGSLAFRQEHSQSIPDAAITHFRWTYRRVGDSQWLKMSEPVIRRFVEEIVGSYPPVVTLGVFPLGPEPHAGEQNLFRFRPATPPLPWPPGRARYWPTNNAAGDINSAYLNTSGLAFGPYEVRVEVWRVWTDGSGEHATQVTPGPGTFTFLVPMPMLPDGTIPTRVAEPGEIVDGGFRFRVHIDNSPTRAEIAPASSGGTSMADACGFLVYDPASDPAAPTVGLAFEASHPQDHAVFRVSLTRAMADVAAPGAFGEVGATNVGPYTSSPAGSGLFSGQFSRNDLMGPCPTRAAFAHVLNVWGKATNGTSRVGYDASDVAAFALSQT